MKTLSMYLWAAVALVLFSCGGAATEQAAESMKSTAGLIDEVMAIHDDAMAKMGEMQSLETEIRSFLETANAEEMADLVAEGSQKAEALATAHESMMGWMRNYKKPETTTAPEEIESYMNGQKEAIQKVQAEINTSLEEGRAFMQRVTAAQ